MILDSIELKDTKLGDEIILAATLNDLFKNVDISESGLSAISISTDNLYVRQGKFYGDDLNLINTNIPNAKFKVGCISPELGIVIMPSKGIGLWWSEDGITFTRGKMEDGSDVSSSWDCGCWDGEKFIFGGDNGIIYSSDGKTWKTTPYTNTANEIKHFYDEVTDKHWYTCGTFVTTETDPTKWKFDGLYTDHDPGAYLYSKHMMIIWVDKWTLETEGTPFTSQGIYSVKFDDENTPIYTKLTPPPGVEVGNFEWGGFDGFLNAKLMIGGKLTECVVMPGFKDGGHFGLAYTIDGENIKIAKGGNPPEGCWPHGDWGFETPSVTKDGGIIVGSQRPNTPFYSHWKDLEEDPVQCTLDGTPMVFGNPIIKDGFSSSPEYSEVGKCWIGCAYKAFEFQIIYSYDGINWYSTDCKGKFTGPTFFKNQVLFGDQDGTIVTFDLTKSTKKAVEYLNKCKGGEVSGDVGIMQHDLNVLSGNYIQTSMSDQVTNYASKNAFIQADVDPHYGDSYAGSKAFCVLGLSSATNQIKLSGDIQVLKDIVDGRLSVGDMHVDINKSNSLRNVFGRRDAIKNETNMSSAMFSLTIDSHATSMTFHLSAVDTSTGIVTLKEPITNGGFGAYNERPQEYFEDIWLNDDNAFYLVGFPELGNANIPNNFGQFVSGGSVRAIGRQTHAEGRDSIADIRYAHAEGSHCTAAQMASHAEGFGTFANKSFAHAEGERTIAEGQGSHAEGYKTEARGLYSHAEGMESLAAARGAHAEGTSVSAFSDSSHAEGYKTEARGLYSHAEGREAVASGPYSHAEGYNTYAIGKQSHASGFKTEAKGENSFTAGENSQALATANNAFVIGRYSRANDTNGRNSFVWQGKYDDTKIYDSNRHGSFNVNPQGGLSGFYIGNNNFIECVLLAVQAMNDTQKNALKTALGL